MPKPTVLTAGTMADICTKAITNINDLFIILALSRTGSHHKGYGPLTVKEIRERLLKLGIDIPSKTIRERHQANPALFGVRGPEHGATDDHKLRVTDPQAVAQVEHLMRSLKPLVFRKMRQPPFLYRRDDWAVVATWSFERFTTRPGTIEELGADIAFRESAEDFA